MKGQCPCLFRTKRQRPAAVFRIFGNLLLHFAGRLHIFRGHFQNASWPGNGNAADAEILFCTVHAQGEIPTAFRIKRHGQKHFGLPDLRLSRLQSGLDAELFAFPCDDGVKRRTVDNGDGEGMSLTDPGGNGKFRGGGMNGKQHECGDK